MQEEFLLENGHKCVQKRLDFLREEIKIMKSFSDLSSEDRVMISQMEKEIQRLKDLASLKVLEPKEQKNFLLPGNAAEIILDDRGKKERKMVILDGVIPTEHQLSQGYEIISYFSSFGKALAGKSAGEKGSYFAEKRYYIFFSIKRIFLPCESKWIFKLEKEEKEYA